MKFRVHLKDPDGFSDGMDEAVELSLKETNLPEDEQEVLRETKQSKISNFIDKWVEYDEYVTLEFDTELGTAIVVSRK